MSSAATIPVRYAREMLVRTGLSATDRTALLTRAGLAPDVVRRRRFRLSARQFDRLYREVVRTTDDECFGYLARPVPSGAYLTMVRQLTRFDDVADCLAGSRDFYALFDSHDLWGLSVDRDVATLVVRPRTRVQARSILFVHVMLISAWRTMAWLAGMPWPLRGITLDPRFADLASETRFLFGCEPRFAEDRAEIRFSSSVLAMPVVRHASDVHAYGASSLLDMIAEAPKSTLEGRIRAKLSSTQPFATASAAGVAKALGMSQSTLTRRLKQLELTFSDLKDDLRRDRAIALLADANRSIADIAEDLGYSEPSAFQRAFKTWTGVAPGRYRS